MIQANELRIGNLLQSNENVILKVVELTENNISTFVIDRSKYPLKNGWSLQPIPLTEEILLKCAGSMKGYVYNGWDDMKMFRFDEYSPNVFELEIINDKFFYGDNKIEFLHDLQNCYFFHENNKKELTINL